MKFLPTAVLIFLVFPFTVLSQKVTIAPRPAWVVPETPSYEAAPAYSENNGSYYLLIDEQVNTVKKSSYNHYAYKMLTTEGIQEKSDISVNFDPSYQRLIFHEVVIRREGKVLSQLTQRAIKTTQREESADRYLYDGSLTAAINLEDIRTGDIVEFSYTLEGFNPVFGDHFSYKVYFDYGIPYKKYVHRLLTKAGFSFLHKTVNGEVPMKKSSIGDLSSYTWVKENNPPMIVDGQTPLWYDPYCYVSVSDFKDWGQVADWAVGHFAISDKTHALLDKELAQHFKQKDKDSLALAAIRFVQDDIRYLGFESGLNSHKPHDPLKVYQQRFGDCKDKSLLLCSILRYAGFEAYPMLISTTWREKLPDQLPAANIFNHCVVQMIYQGKIVCVDPTISNQGGLIATTYFPRYAKGLVIKDGTHDLSDIPDAPPSDISEDQTYSMNDIGGETSVSVRTVYRGVEADIQRSQFASRSLYSIQKDYLTFYANIYPEIEKADTISFNDNRRENIFTVNEKYRIPKIWKENENDKEQLFAEFYPISLETYFNISKSTQRTGPYVLNYPLSYHHTITIKLPEDWPIEREESQLPSPYYDYTHDVSYKDREIVLYTHYETKSPYVPVDYFPLFLKDHQTMMKNLSYTLTYRKELTGAASISWIALCVLILGIAVFSVIAVRLYYQYDPQPELPNEGGEPLGGWLLLLVIGVMVSPIIIGYSIFFNSEYFNNNMWSGLVRLGRWDLVIFVGAEFIYNLLRLVYSFLIAALFVQRRSSLPRLMVIYLIATTVMETLDSLLVYYLVQDNKDAFDGLPEVLISTAIWVPYFLKSMRVKETFVERIDGHERTDRSADDLPSGVTE